MTTVIAALLTAALACQGEAGAELERWLAALDRAQEPAESEARAQLGRRGARAALRALEGFAAQPYSARRARARFLAERPSAEACAPVLASIGDPDPEVRRWLAEVLGNPALAEAMASERVAALAALAADDVDDGVRASARSGLIECALDAAVPALDRLLDGLPGPESEAVAEGLARLPAARERLVARVVGMATQALPPLPGSVRAALLRGYGRALAEVPGGGEELRERLPFLLARLDPALEVGAAARGALATFVARAAELEEGERAERVLAALGTEGWPLTECLRRRLDLAWHERGDAAAALALAQELERAVRVQPPEDAEAWEWRAELFEGAALYALGERERARAAFAALAQRLAASRTRRTDLFPSPSAREPTEGGGVDTIDHLHLAGLVHLWRALLALEGQPSEVRRELRAAHVDFWQSRVVARRTRADDPGTLDSLLDRDLSPYTLVLFNERLAPAQRGAALDQALALAQAWGEVAPLEMQGLASPSADPLLGDVFRDPERLALLKAMRAAELDDLQRQLDDLHGPLGNRDDDPDLERFVKIHGYQLRKAAEDEMTELRKNPDAAPSQVYTQLLDYISPSVHALTLAGHLRGEGRSREARELCERALATLRTAPLGSSTWSELSSARFQILLGSTLMDEEKPREAEQALLEAERRLLAIEQTMEEQLAGARDPGGLRDYLTQLKNLRGDALLSLAVNANVRMGDPKRALEFFERAFELNQSPFMRILRACYRARSGEADEARTVLASVVPVPSLYYNIACTHALLGEKELALDFLERDFRANCPSPGSLAQKREWAVKDPDLKGLRGEPRFQRLLGGP